MTNLMDIKRKITTLVMAFLLRIAVKINSQPVAPF